MARPYNSQLDAFDIYHQTQEGRRPKKGTAIGPALPALGHAVSGSAGSAISHLLVYPLDLLITRLQVQRQLSGSEASTDNKEREYAGFADAVKRIYRDEGGLGAFYTGAAQDTAKSVADSFLFFLAYTFLRERRLSSTTSTSSSGSPKRTLATVDELAVGMLAGAFARFVTAPAQNVVTRAQTAAVVDTESKPSMGDIARQIRKERGVRGFWSGYSATLVLTLNPSITFLLHESLLRALAPRDRRKDPGPRTTFLIAAASKAIASVITYPFSVARTRVQVSAKSTSSTAKSSNEVDGVPDGQTRHARRDTIVSMILRIVQSEGILGLYRGAGGQVVKGFFEHGLTMLMKEQIFAVVVQLYYVLLKILRRYPSPAELAKLAEEEAAKSVSDMVHQTEQMIQTGVEKGKDVLKGP
ncbi:mitochondrial carrier domain-containing protein [Lineolata rhizophorae]|uniref:Mitochondrial carrier domain-containing protein n=1 Tax=Lineolata rhizophorae TaxID=578093 RepID=A0A6A6NRA1_9PEZI|nr:mitochondrial carrier domain-containing protein [Lineolata rhizophorae]